MFLHIYCSIQYVLAPDPDSYLSIRIRIRLLLYSTNPDPRIQNRIRITACNKDEFLEP